MMFEFSVGTFLGWECPSATSECLVVPPAHPNPEALMMLLNRDEFHEMSLG